MILDSLLKHSHQNSQVIYDTLASVGFRNEEMSRLYGRLSAGQKIKANLAKILVGNFNLLFFDEPNNYLDIIVLQALEKFLENYNGTYILVTHDRTLRDSVKHQVFYMDSLELSSNRNT